ncbi:retinal rod rhodopsin-sensitive cGMP 3',5'-cyclic phosphodiesterase subunit gamma [Pseudopipra pipra]|uniref:retinal rod rhodopsin-sensitive cGMP 3',5'-cyclic phosphodiesterase subunit gamma n=1 Tax=Pseudopipra pipra TaxID=415032 RepID=UPI0031391246
MDKSPSRKAPQSISGLWDGGSSAGLGNRGTVRCKQLSRASAGSAGNAVSWGWLPAPPRAMSLEPPKLEVKSATRVTGGPATPRKGPPKFKQRQTRQFKSKPPKKGVQGFGDDIPGMEGLGTDITVICPWEAFSHLELHELAQYGII